MFGGNESRIFTMQEAHKLNSCNHNKYKNPPIREDRRVFYVGKFFGVGKRCFLCRQTFLASHRSVSTQKEGHALAA